MPEQPEVMYKYGKLYRFNPSTKFYELVAEEPQSAFKPETLGIKSLVDPSQQIKGFGELASYLGGRTFQAVRPLAAAAAVAALPEATPLTTRLLYGSMADLLAQIPARKAGLSTRSMVGSFTGITEEVDPYLGAIESAAINEVGGAMGAKLFETMRAIKAGFQGKMPGRFAPFQRFPEIPASYSQITASKAAKYAEQLPTISSSSKQQMAANLAGQQVGKKEIGKLLGRDVSEYVNPEDFAREFGVSLRIAREGLLHQSNTSAQVAISIAKAPPNALLQKFSLGKKPTGIVGPDGKPIMQEQFEDLTSSGPISLDRAIDFAKNIVKQWQDIYGNKSAGELIDIVQVQDKPILALARDVLKYDRADVTGIGQKAPFEAAWDLKRAADAIAYGPHRDYTIPHQKRLFGTLARIVDKDIQESIGDWRVLQQPALQGYVSAKVAAQKRITLLEQHDVIEKFMRREDVTNRVTEFRAIINDTKLIGRTLSAGADPKILAASKLQDILTKSYLNTENRFSPVNLAKYLNDPKEIAIMKKLFGTEYDYITDFLKVLSGVGQEPIQLGKYAVGITAAKSAIFLAPTLVAGATYGTIGSGSIVGAYVGLNTFARYVLLNPKVNRKIIPFMYPQKVTPEARDVARTIFAALRGQHIILQTSDDRYIEAEFTKEGKIKIP